MCATLVDELQDLNDPRLELWARKIDIPIIVVTSPADRDEIVNGIRYVGQDIALIMYCINGIRLMKTRSMLDFLQPGRTYPRHTI